MLWLDLNEYPSLGSTSMILSGNELYEQDSGDRQWGNGHDIMSNEAIGWMLRSIQGRDADSGRFGRSGNK